MSKPTLRLFDFQVENTEFDDFDEENGDKKKFLIKMFGMNEKGKTYCIYVKDFLPYFYILVPDNWDKTYIVPFKQYIIQLIGDYYQKSVISCKLIKRKTLYGFDNFKNYKFLRMILKSNGFQ